MNFWEHLLEEKPKEEPPVKRAATGPEIFDMIMCLMSKSPNPSSEIQELYSEILKKREHTSDVPEIKWDYDHNRSKL